VTVKAGISRVVWKRPREILGFRRRSSSRAEITESIPFLAIARSLGQHSLLIYTTVNTTSEFRNVR